jgi:hypothetical protein
VLPVALLVYRDSNVTTMLPKGSSTCRVCFESETMTAGSVCASVSDPISMFFKGAESKNFLVLSSTIVFAANG